MKKVKWVINRKESVVTGKRNLKPLYSFKNFPVFMGCVDQKQKKDWVFDMDWVIDPESGVIQLKKLLPLKLVYQNQHNDGVGKVWDDHYSKFSLFLKWFKPKNVLEIGAANGIVANKYLGLDSKVKWTIVEPHPIFKGNKKIKVIKAWFDKKMAKKVQDSGFDTIIHTHVLEHIYDPQAFLKDINGALKVGDKHIFSLPNMYEQLRRKYTNCLNFEHTLFLTEEIVDFLLIRSGFRVLKKKYFSEHSIFYSTEKVTASKKSVIMPHLYKRNLLLFNNFIDYHKSLVEKLNRKIGNAKCPVYIFGAHIFTQALFNSGLDEKLIAGVLDNSTQKQGKRLYGSHFKVESPKRLTGQNRVYVILKAGAYNAEIKADILKNINPDVKFL